MKLTRFQRSQNAHKTLRDKYNLLRKTKENKAKSMYHQIMLKDQKDNGKVSPQYIKKATYDRAWVWANTYGMKSYG